MSVAPVKFDLETFRDPTNPSQSSHPTARPTPTPGRDPPIPSQTRPPLYSDRSYFVPPYQPSFNPQSQPPQPFIPPSFNTQPQNVMLTDATKSQHSCPNCGHIIICDRNVVPVVEDVGPREKRYHEPIILNAARASRQEKARRNALSWRPQSRLRRSDGDELPQETLEDLLEAAKEDSRRRTMGDGSYRDDLAGEQNNATFGAGVGGGFSDAMFGRVDGTPGAIDRFGTPMGNMGSPFGGFGSPSGNFGFAQETTSPRETTQPFRDMMMRTDAGTSTAVPPIADSSTQIPGLSGTTSTQGSFVSATGSDTDLRDLQQKEAQVIKLPPVPENDPTFGYKKLNVVNGMPRKSTIEMKKPLPNPVPMEDDNASAEKGIWSRLWGWG